MSHSYSGGYSNTPAERTSSQSMSDNPKRILIDWVGFTVSTDLYSDSDVLRFFEVALSIPFDSWSEGRRNYEGYAKSWVFENINIYYEGQEGQGIHVDITGQGCRFIEIQYQKLGVQEYNWYQFLSVLEGMDVKFTRFDVACDIFTEEFSVEDLFYKCLKGELKMKFKSWEPAGKFGRDGKNKSGLTLYFGSKQSRMQLVIYEKSKQLGVDEVWNRFEMRFKQERAGEFVSLFLDANGDKSLGVLYAGVVKEYITFLEANPNDSNHRRWPTAKFWSDFLDGVEPLQLAAAPPDRSILKSVNWLTKQVSKTIAMCYFAHQDIDDDWLRKIHAEGATKLGKKELNIIEEFRRMHEKPDYHLLDDPRIVKTVNPDDKKNNPSPRG